jgi:hypothetical protein
VLLLGGATIATPAGNCASCLSGQSELSLYYGLHHFFESILLEILLASAAALF